MTEDLYITKRSLELEWQHEHLKAGKHNIRMIEINKKIQDVIKEIIAKEFEADNSSNQNKRRQERSFDSHLSAIKNHTFL